MEKSQLFAYRKPVFRVVLQSFQKEDPIHRVIVLTLISQSMPRVAIPGGNLRKTFQELANLLPPEQFFWANFPRWGNFLCSNP